MKQVLVTLLFLFFTTTSMFPQSKTHAFEVNKRLSRGINIGNTFEAPSEYDWGNPWNPDYLKMIADLGFSHVRLPIRWEVPERTKTAPPYTISPEFLERIKSVVDEALRQKLHIIINMHHHESLADDPMGQKACFLSQWQQIADYFKEYPDSLLFEILNEPQKDLSDPVRWSTFTADALAEIRKTNPDRIVLICSSTWGGINGMNALLLPNDPNLILTVHYYNPFEFTHQGADFAGLEHNTGIKWLDTDMARAVVWQDFMETREFAKKHNIPVHVGEFGAYHKADIDSRVRWTTFLARFFEEQGYSWAYWEFSAGFGIYNPQTQTYLQPLVNALLYNPMPEPSLTEASTFYESDFENKGLGSWIFYAQSGAKGNAQVINDKLTVNITKEGSDSWQLQLTNPTISLKQGQQYRISFTASASKECVGACYLGRNASPWDIYSSYGSLPLYTNEKQYAYVFTMQDRSDPATRIVFDFGMINAPATISLCDIKMELIQTVSSANEPIRGGDLVYSFSPDQNSLILSNHAGYQQVSLYSITGAKLLSQPLTADSNTLYVHSFPPGVYILVCEKDGLIHSEKILKSY